MKTKNKVLALLEIAVVLCSVLLVATLPAIAAEQNQEMQKVSAITTASEDDFVLGIYGNANEDDTIDMRDVTYTKLVIFGKKPETELADAYYDGEVDVLDVVQIKLIILGRESELTIVQYNFGTGDIAEVPVTVPIPIERIVSMNSYAAETLCALGEQDRIVGVDEYTKEIGELKTFMEDKPVVGTGYTGWDIEKIIERNPGIVLALSYHYPGYGEQLSTVGIPLVQMDFYQLENYLMEIRILGWMLHTKERTEELINFEQQHFDLIEERVKDLKEEQKPRVFFEFYGCYITAGPGNANHDAIVMCGGINIFDDLETSWAYIDPEEVIARNPQVILEGIYTTLVPSGYDVADTGPMEEYRDDIMSRPAWDTIDAVRNGKVYIINHDTASTHSSVYLSYVAKWLHPELFEDVDPVAIHEEWFERFLGIEYQGVYAYPTYSV